MNAKRIKLVIFSFLSSVKLSLVGQLVLSEVFAVLNCLSLKGLSRSYALTPDLKKIHGAFLTFLGAQMFSDFVNHSPMENLMKGWAAIIMAMFIITFMFKMFEENPDLIVIFMAAEIFRLIVFGQSKIELETDVLLEEHSIFKFRIAPITNNIILLISYYFYKNDRRERAIYLFVLYGLMSMALDARSNGVYFLLAAMIMGFRSRLMNTTPRQMFRVILVLVVFFQMLYMGYVYAVLSGSFGGAHTREQIDRLENPYNPLYLMMSGRPEVFVAIEAIKDKPLFGHGSWPHDENNHYRSLMWKDYDMERIRAVSLTDAEIPSHSMIFGAWLNSGLVGMCAIFYFCFLGVRRAFYVIRSEKGYETPYYPIIILFVIELIWTSLFSPLSHIRTDIPIIVAFIVIVCNVVRNAEEEEEEMEDEEEEDMEEAEAEDQIAYYSK